MTREEADFVIGEMIGELMHRILIMVAVMWK